MNGFTVNIVIVEGRLEISLFSVKFVICDLEEAKRNVLHDLAFVAQIPCTAVQWLYLLLCGIELGFTAPACMLEL